MSLSSRRHLLQPIVFALGLLAVGACSSSDSLPTVADPAQLTKDAEQLLAGPHKGVVPQPEWPASIAALHPREVTVINDEIVVTCEVATGVGARGYVLDPRNSPIDPRLQARATSNAGIYKFEWQPQP